MSIFLDGLHRIHSINHVNSSLHREEGSSLEPPALTGFLSLCRKDKYNTKMDDKDMDGPIYRCSGISQVISLMESLTLPWDQNEASPGDAGKANDLS